MRFSKKISGGDEGIRLSRELRAQSFAALTVHRTVIHYRSYFESRRRFEPKLRCLNFGSGGDEGIRTLDPLLAGQVLSQLSYTPMGLDLLSFR